MRDKINWSQVVQGNTVPKRALKKAINKAGNSNKLAQLLGTSRQHISILVHKHCLPGNRLMADELANRIRKAVKIKGIEKDLARVY